MKWSEVIRIAKEKGWYLLRRGSKHDIYQHDEKDFFILIERHLSSEIKPGLYQKLKKQIGF